MGEKTRRHRRVATDLAVTVRMRGDETTFGAGRIRNISLGGVFIEMEPVGFGTELELSFRLPGHGGDVTCEGLVVWSTQESPEKAKNKRGCGIRLSNISVADMRKLAEMIDGKKAQ